MPHLRVRFLTEEQTRELSVQLIPELAAKTQTPADHYTLELIATAAFREGKSVTGEPFCEVLWFDRGREMQDEVAQLITQVIQNVRPEVDVVVTFTNLPKDAYYENGRHFGPSSP